MTSAALIFLLLGTGQILRTVSSSTCHGINVCSDCTEANCKFAYEIGETIKSRCVDLYDHKPSVYYAPTKESCLGFASDERRLLETSTSFPKPKPENEKTIQNKIPINAIQEEKDHVNSSEDSKDNDPDELYTFMKKMLTRECGIAFAAGVMSCIILIIFLLCLRAVLCSTEKSQTRKMMNCYSRTQKTFKEKEAEEEFTPIDLQEIVIPAHQDPQSVEFTRHNIESSV